MYKVPAQHSELSTSESLGNELPLLPSLARVSFPASLPLSPRRLRLRPAAVACPRHRTPPLLRSPPPRAPTPVFPLPRSPPPRAPLLFPPDGSEHGLSLLARRRRTQLRPPSPSPSLSSPSLAELLQALSSKPAPNPRCDRAGGGTAAVGVGGGGTTAATPAAVLACSPPSSPAAGCSLDRRPNSKSPNSFPWWLQSKQDLEIGTPFDF